MHHRAPSARAARAAGILVICAVAVFASTLVWSAAMTDAPDEVVIDKVAAKKKAVLFPHKKHVDAAIDCKTCHHTVKEGETPKACSECHKAEPDGDTPKAATAFHETCKKCHADRKKAKEKTGPTACGDCHTGAKAGDGAKPEPSGTPDEPPPAPEPEPAPAPEPTPAPAPDTAP